jgi:two-component system chemotaxis response regulator CheB
MVKGRKIRVLVVDDSLVFREIIKRGISSDPLIEVVSLAADPFEARDKILEFLPDVITCDVEMPKMNGIEFVRRLIPQYFVPVVMVSSLNNAVFEALEAGAVDFVAKSDMQSAKGIEAFISELIEKIKIASTVKSARPRPRNSQINPASIKAGSGKIIAIGASTGGTEAIYSILRSLPPTLPGIVIVQHIPPVFSTMFAQRLNSQTALEVKEAQTGDLVEPGRVFVAPGDRHIRLKKLGSRYKIECFEGNKVSGHCPSVDVLFESVANEAKDRAIGIILTGMGYDGANGLLSMRRRGAKTIGQDEASSVVYGMPKTAFNIGAVEVQAPLGDIPRILLDMLR